MINEPSQQEYEFTQGQNDTIRRLASAMKFVAIIEIILGVLLGILALFSLLGGGLGNFIVYSIDCVITIVLAALLSAAGTYFYNIVDTQGSDVMHLMSALEKLRSYFNIKRVLYIIAMCLFVLGIIFAILMFTSRSNEPRQSYGYNAGSSSTMPVGLSAGAV